MRNLSILNLEGNRIKKIEGLESLSNLQDLNLSNNQIERLYQLTSLKKLRFLRLKQNRIRKIENLRSLENLEYLQLDNNQITEIDGDEFPLYLHLVLLADNQIKKIKNLPLNQTIFHLENNELDTMKGIEEHIRKVKIYLFENPIMKEVLSKYPQWAAIERYWNRKSSAEIEEKD
ncbi:MAG: leucine-rich repeat domain-containing protein [Candidatus Helarchaeota archaeon]